MIESGSAVSNPIIPLGASVIGWCLAIANYDGFAEVLTPQVRQAIYTFSIYIPLALFVALFILTLKFDLEDKIAGYREEVNRRKNESN